MILELEAKKIVEHFTTELSKIRTGRASSELVDEISIEVYGQQMPLQQVASVAVPEPRSITIQPWDKSNMKAIEKALSDADLGMQPNNTGDRIVLNLPLLTEESRIQFVKQARQKGEKAKIALRNIREAAIRKSKDEDPSEDQQRQAKEKIQKTIDLQNKNIDETLKTNENDIMTI